MILVEADDDLAECVSDYFRDRYTVTRLGSLQEASEALDRPETSLLFADVGSDSAEELSVLVGLRQDHPGLKIVLTYLAPLALESWEEKLRESAHVLVRKPYGVLDVDRALRALDEDESERPN